MASWVTFPPPSAAIKKFATNCPYVTIQPPSAAGKKFATNYPN